jgi:hypothetical protein
MVGYETRFVDVSHSRRLNHGEHRERERRHAGVIGGAHSQPDPLDTRRRPDPVGNSRRVEHEIVNARVSRLTHPRHAVRSVFVAGKFPLALEGRHVAIRKRVVISIADKGAQECQGGDAAPQRGVPHRRPSVHGDVGQTGHARREKCRECDKALGVAYGRRMDGCGDRADRD